MFRLQSRGAVVRLLLEHDTPVDIVALQCAVDAEDDEVRISAIIKSPRQPKQEIERIVFCHLRL